jgi:hypothetical protein
MSDISTVLKTIDMAAVQKNYKEIEKNQFHKAPI